MQNQEYIKEICAPYIKKNNHHKPQVTDSYGVVIKRGNIQLELTKVGLVLTDGWTTNWVILYGFNNRWAADSQSFTGNKAIKERLDKIATKYTEKEKQQWNTTQNTTHPHNGTMRATMLQQSKSLAAISA